MEKEILIPIVKHWAIISHWTVEEAAYLSIGISPNSSNLDWPLLCEFQDRLHLLNNAYAQGHLNSEGISNVCMKKIPAKEILSWLRAKEIPFPKELEDAVNRFSENYVNWKSKYHEEIEAVKKENERLKDKEINDKSRSTAYKIIYAMAMTKGFNHNPDGNSDATKNILSALEQQGLSVSERTIRDWLKDATAYVKDQQS